MNGLFVALYVLGVLMFGAVIAITMGGPRFTVIIGDIRFNKFVAKHLRSELAADEYEILPKIRRWHVSRHRYMPQVPECQLLSAEELRNFGIEVPS